MEERDENLILSEEETAEAGKDSIEVEGVTMTFEKPVDPQLDLF